MTISGSWYDLNNPRIRSSPSFLRDAPAGLTFFNTNVPLPMNRRVIRQILIALGIFAGIILVFILLAQFG